MLVEKEIKELYTIMVEHPSRTNPILVKEIKDGAITKVYDNRETMLDSPLFETYAEANCARLALNTSCETYVKKIGPVNFNKLEGIGLVKVKFLGCTKHLTCYVRKDHYRLRGA